MLQHETFALCFHDKGGTMVLGGDEPAAWTAPMEYTRSLHDAGWFTVEMTDLLIDGGSIGADPGIYNRGKVRVLYENSVLITSA